MIKTLKKLFIFAFVVVIYQLNSYNLVMASNVSTESKIQVTSVNDKSKHSMEQNSIKPIEAHNISKAQISSDSSDASKLDGNIAFSTSNLNNVENVPINKIWTIEFNQTMNLSSAKNSIKIIDKKTNKEVPVSISLDKNDFCVVISSISSYAYDNYYTLSIDGNLKSDKNKILKTPVSMDFKTASMPAVNKITSIDNINASIKQGDSYKLPDEVTANMSNGEKRQVKVNWDKHSDNLNVSGTYVYQGYVEGYDKKVTLNLTISSSSTSTNTNTNNNNNTNTNDNNKNTLSSISTTTAWIWQLQNQVDTYGGIDNLISKLKSLGITNVCVKYNEGERATGGGMNFRGDFLKYVDNFKKAGFKVGTWGFNHFNNVEGEANLIIDAVKNSDYYVFDVEDAVIGKTEQSEKVCQLVRNQCPNAVLGYTSYPIASYHQDIAYSVFNKYCDFSAPQCYWGEMKWPIKKCMDKMIQDYKNYGLDKPIFPLVQTYDVYYSDYADYAAYKFKCTGLWSFDEIGATCIDFLKCEGSKLNN
ncbi:hypothetical protein HBE96_20580 [Clostridium sp. P21]|uniref:Uncharacterized protein n=1 Tax=Clostridium muellerianum TaxID=2716538 RepID=A0A7Y0EM71_9CLOT|nr:Ig-like domain-containing protein [Clostridium muellerianum]NMM64990.1 hypothetical protein [Clostridium muellerianum]